MDLIKLSDVMTGLVCTTGFVLFNREQPTPYNVGKRVGASVAGRMVQENSKLPSIALPYNTELSGKDMATGLAGASIALAEGKSVQNAILNDGLRLKLSSMITREGMKVLGVADMKLL
jgi:hypothetical protein